MAQRSCGDVASQNAVDPLATRLAARRVPSGLLHAIALARAALVWIRPGLENSPLERARLIAENTALRAYAAQLREELRIKDARMDSLDQYSRYERGTSRPSADALARLADALGVSTDYLLEGSTEDAARADFKDRELLRQFQEVEKLPQEDKDVIKKLLDAFLTKKQLQRLAAR